MGRVFNLAVQVLVDGALIRYMICGPLHWLGIVDLGSSVRGGQPEAFRLSNMSECLLTSQPLKGAREEKGLFTVARNGLVTCPRNVPRAARYQLDRFCEWLGVDGRGYRYQICLDSLRGAVQKGLQVEQLISLMTRYAISSLPSSLVDSLQRWVENGVQVQLSNVVILQVKAAAILKELHNSPVARFFGEILNENTVTLPATAAEKVIPQILELGYLCQVDGDALSIARNRD